MTKTSADQHNSVNLCNRGKRSYISYHSTPVLASCSLSTSVGGRVAQAAHDYGDIDCMQTQTCRGWVRKKLVALRSHKSGSRKLADTKS